MKLQPANDGKKKWIAIFNDGTTTKFGSYGMEDYTQHHDKERRRLFLKRFHKLIEKNKDNPKSAMTLSTMLLWNKPTLEASLKDYKKMFGDL